MRYNKQIQNKKKAVKMLKHFHRLPYNRTLITSPVSVPT